MGIRSLISLVIAFTLVWAAKPDHRESKAGPENLFRTATIVEHTVWDGNLISTWHGNHGDWVSYHVTGNAGLEWPKGGGKTAVFQSGLWLAAGKTRAPGGDWKQEIRTAGSEYVSEFVPGTIDGQDGHIYEIHRAELDAFLNNDFATYSQMSAELSITEGTERVTTTVHFPTSDFENWPAHLGAPWVDTNEDGVYNIEDGDHPDILGDQFHWYIMNDGDAAQHTPLWGTAPMNVEVHNSVFGFDQAGPLGSIMFTRSVIINKGSEDLDSVFASIWHDDDVGDATDDLVGADTTLSLGYTYNDADGDATYGVEAPASGADFFQGPLVYSPGDTASILTWSLEKSYHLRDVLDYKELPMTSFVAYINPNPTLRDPETAEQAYRFMNAQVGLTGECIKDPDGNCTNFVYPGDPATGSGWLDAEEFPPGDRRFLMNSGPFYLGRGDTAEVVGCVIIAAGSNWAKSVTKLKYFDKFAQAAFDANFEVCSPAIPNVSLSQLDRKIVLTFEEAHETVESYSCLDYGFEAYNVYQGESPNGPWYRIATFDVINDVKVILDLTLDEDTGELIELPVQFGTDSGVEHYIEITRDAIRNTRLINGRKYYFSVTSFAYDPDAAQRVIESPVKPITAIPMEPVLGSSLESTYGDLVDVTQVSGVANAKIEVFIVDPYQLTNDDYEISFTTTEDTINTWNLVNATDNDTVFAGVEAFPVTREYYNAQTVDGSRPDLLPGTYITNEVTDGFILTFKGATYEAPTGNFSWEQTVDADEDTVTQLKYIGEEKTWAQFLDDFNLSGGATESKELQKDIRLVFTEEPQKGYYFDGSSPDLEVKDVPFEVWSAEDSVRINALIWVLTGGKDLVHYPDTLVHPETGASVPVGRFWNHYVVPIYEPYTTEGAFKAWDEGSEAIGWRMKFNQSASAYLTGDEVVVEFTNTILPGEDVFAFSTAGLMEASKRLVEDQLKKVNVFPNPYFGRNVEEVNPLDRFITFTHLGVGKHTIRIFSLAGDMIRKIEQENVAENSPGNLVRWDLRNQAGIPVASGMYIAHIKTPHGDKVLKLAVFMPEERLDVY